MMIPQPITWSGGRAVEPVRSLAAGLSLVVVVSAASVQAPGLALLALPFVVAAAAPPRRRPALVLLWLAAMLFAGIGVAFVAAIGFEAGWSDLLFAYVGTPLAAALAVVLGRRLFRP